jgi:hypothetical protein
MESSKTKALVFFCAFYCARALVEADTIQQGFHSHMLPKICKKIAVNLINILT